MKIQPKTVHEFRLQPQSSAETVGANSVLDQETSEDISVSAEDIECHCTLYSVVWRC